MRVLLLQHGPGPRDLGANIDPVLARCSGIWSKANYAMPPVGLLSCATILERDVDGCRCDVLDLAHDRLHGAAALEAMRSVGAEVLIHTPASASLERDLTAVRDWQHAHPGGWVVALGTHASEEPASVLRADRQAVVHGEPEARLVRLVQALTRGASSRELGALPGISMRVDGELRRGPADGSLLDLDSLPIPDRRWVVGHRYRPPFARPGPFALVLASRGCPHGCHFCASQAFYGQEFRQRSSALVLEEVQALARHGIDTVGFWDDSFTVDRRWVLELCAGLEAMPRRPGWICMSRADAVDPELLAAMARAGCYQIQFGVESASELLLTELGKPTSNARVRRAFADAREAGLETAGFFMLGLPGESVPQRRATVRFALELDPDYVSFNLFSALPGTPVYRALGGASREWSRANGASARGGDRALERDLGLAYLRFYARPRYLGRQLRGLRSSERALVLVRSGARVMRSAVERLWGP